MTSVFQDIRFALRMLARSPGFAAVAVLTLALGIGANTAFFSVVHGVLLKPMPYEQPDQLYMLWSHYPDFGRVPTSGPDFVDFQQRSTVFQDVAAYYAPSVTLTVEGAAPERLRAALVTEAFFRVLREEPILGRTFTAEELTPVSGPGASAGGSSVVLSHEFWQRHFGGDSGVLGRTVMLNAVPREVVGVAPPSLSFPRDAQFWIPITFDLANINRRSEFLSIIARAKPGVTPEAAQAEMSVISAQLKEEFPQSNATITGQAVALHEQVVGGIRPALLALWGAVAFVLLIVTANVANLLLGRAAAREREIAVRVALGARRGRLIRQLLTESLLLAVIGGALGVLLAHWLLAGLAALAPSDLPRLEQIQLEGAVLLFALGASLVAGMLFGLAPALQTARPDLNVSLKEGSQGAGHGRATQRMRSALIVSEVALSVILLAGAGLMIRSFNQLLSVDPGFRTENILAFNVSLPRQQYSENPQVVAFYDRLLERLRALPGVESAAATDSLFFTGADYLTFDIEGRPQPPPGSGEDTQVRRVSADLHGLMGIPIVRGRAFTEADGPGAPFVALVNQTFSDRYLPGEDPIGRRVQVGGNPNWYEVVGVVADVRQRGLDRETYPEVQLPYTQDAERGLTLLLRSSGRPEELVAAARAAVQALDSALPIFGVRTVEALVQETVASRRFQMLLFGFFAGIALLLAAIGIYGVLSHAVAQRTSEIGVRMALGARPRDILALVLSGGMRTVLLGVAIGLAGAVLLTRFLRTLLFGVAPHDPLTLVAVAATLTAVAALACYIPARRATKVDPMVALRYE